MKLQTYKSWLLPGQKVELSKDVHILKVDSKAKGKGHITQDLLVFKGLPVYCYKANKKYDFTKGWNTLVERVTDSLVALNILGIEIINP